MDIIIFPSENPSQTHGVVNVYKTEQLENGLVEAMALGGAEGHPFHIHHQLFIISPSLKILFSV